VKEGLTSGTELVGHGRELVCKLSSFHTRCVAYRSVAEKKRDTEDFLGHIGRRWRTMWRKRVSNNVTSTTTPPSRSAESDADGDGVIGHVR
jgi:hypothetical protein